MVPSSQHPIPRIVALCCAILVLGLALIKPAIIEHHLFSSTPFARVHEGRIRNATADLDDTTVVDKEIQQVAHRVLPIALNLEKEQRFWTSLVISPDLEVPSEVRRIPHRRISSSSNSDPDFLS